MEHAVRKPLLECRIFQSSLRSALTKLGNTVGRYPLQSCVIPVVLTALLSFGFLSFDFCKGYEHLYAPINGRSFKEREAIESTFPASKGDINLISITRFQHAVSVIILPKDEGSVLRETIMDEAENIDKIVYNITISWRNESFTFKDICSKTVLEECQPNEVLQLRGKIEDINRKKTLVEYPFYLDDISQRITIYGIGLGGVTTDKNEHVVDAKALRLIYALNYTTTEQSEIGSVWQESFLETISNLKSEHVRIIRFSGVTMDNELHRITEMTLPLLPIMVFLMVTFAILTCLTADCVTSKPWVAVAGCICPTLGGFSAFGLMLMAGIPYVDINITIPFLLTGIGLDDSFIMLAAWRRTDPKETVEERISKTYSEAAICITITSLTNFLSFCVGMGTPYRMARIFCAYAATSVFFSYMYQITFFGGALALSGIREGRNLHSVFCFPVKEDMAKESTSSKHLCGCDKNKTETKIKRKSCFIPCYAEVFLSCIVTVIGKTTVIGCFMLYLISSAYFLSFVKEGMDFRDATSRSSYFVEYITQYYKYFTQYDQPIHLVINKTLDYSDKEVQRNVEETLHSFCTIPNMADEKYSISWLKYYLQSTKDKKYWLAYYGYNMSNPKHFMEGLRNVFLKFRNSRDFKQHIKFNTNKTKILASRFIVFGKNVDTSFEQKRLLETLWKKADSSIYPIYVHSFWFPAYNVLISNVNVCIISLCIAAGLVTIIFFIIIPDLFCALSIMFTIVSIQIGIIGYMSWWDIPVGMISTLCLIASIGLSVDYTSHVSYAYLSCKENNPNKKTQIALRATAYPIFQGCISTVLGVVILYFGETNALLIFCKIIVLMMLISFFHGILVIPIILNIIDTVRIKIFRKYNEAPHRTNEGTHLKAMVC